MNGSESLVRTLATCGVEVCFANPGTSEMHFVAALDAVPAIRPVLCLFEGVATGAADGYGRMTGKPAVTLLHLGPGLANGLANLHNARKARSPVVNIVGNHASTHLQYDAPLTSDVAGFARPVSSWVFESASAKSVASDAARAVQAARQAPGAVATLILPADTAWDEADDAASPLPDVPPAPVASRAIDRVAGLLGNGKRTALLLRGPALLARGLEAAGRIAGRSGARLLCDTFAPHTRRGAGQVPVERIPYFPEQIVDFLSGVEQLVLVAAKPPVSFFAYPDKPSWCVPDGCFITYLAHDHEDGVVALEQLASAIGAPAAAPLHAPLKLPDRPTGALDVVKAGQILAHYLPENAILAEEAATSGVPLMQMTLTARPHDHLALAGGSIGQSLPLAVGAAIACPDRKVVCPHGDGGAAYTLQALWTMARERLDITTVIFANRAYAILNIELARVGAGVAGERARSLFDLTDPALNWARIGGGLGVESTRAATCEEFADQLESAVAQRAPRLIEAVI
jgi:acetolactate synthase I/II/III large subunit